MISQTCYYFNFFETQVKDIKTGEAQLVVEKMNDIQAKAFEELKLARFLSMI